MIGDGRVRIDGVGKDMRSIADKLLSLANTSGYIRQKKINELNSINSTSRNLIEDTISNENEEKLNKENVEFFHDKIMKEYIIKNTLSIISNLSDYKDKVGCLMFMLTKGLHITFKDIFKLDENIEGFDDLNKDNHKINEALTKIIEEVYQNSSEIDKIKEEFKKQVKPEIYKYFEQNYTERDLMNFRTSNFYRDLNRFLGERWTNMDKEVVSKFLSKYKKTKKEIVIKPVKYYCNIFQVSEHVWKNRFKALAIITNLSGESLLNLTA